MKKILITGADGFIGRQTLAGFKALGYEVHGTTMVDRPQDEYYWHKVNLLDEADINQVFGEVKPTHFLHLAWDVTPGKYRDNIDNFTWVQYSLAMLRAFARNGGQRVVTAGTCMQYEFVEQECNELASPRLPATNYGKSKQLLEDLFAAYAQAAGLSYACGYVFFLYGAGEKPGRLVSDVILALLQGREAKCSHGRQLRDFMYVSDVGEAFVQLTDGGFEGGVNIADGRPVTLAEIVQTAAEIIGRPELVRLGALPAGKEPLQFTANTKRLNEEVGFTPKNTLRQGLEKSVAWFKQHLEEYQK